MTLVPSGNAIFSVPSESILFTDPSANDIWRVPLGYLISSWPLKKQNKKMAIFFSQTFPAYILMFFDKVLFKVILVIAKIYWHHLPNQLYNS